MRRRPPDRGPGWVQAARRRAGARGRRAGARDGRPGAAPADASRAPAAVPRRRLPRSRARGTSARVKGRAAGALRPGAQGAGIPGRPRVPAGPGLGAQHVSRQWRSRAHWRRASCWGRDRPRPAEVPVQRGHRRQAARPAARPSASAGRRRAGTSRPGAPRRARRCPQGAILRRAAAGAAPAPSAPAARTTAGRRWPGRPTAMSPHAAALPPASCLRHYLRSTGHVPYPSQTLVRAHFRSIAFVCRSSH